MRKWPKEISLKEWQRAQRENLYWCDLCEAFVGREGDKLCEMCGLDPPIHHMVAYNLGRFDIDAPLAKVLPFAKGLK